jgi:ribonuclease P protein subunit RPR2
MARKSRASRRRKSERKNFAERAIIHLSTVLEKNLGQKEMIADNASRQILALSKKHGVRPNSGIRRNICRSCKQSLAPGITSRVRISSRTLIITCLRCGSKSRQGPDFGG